MTLIHWPMKDVFEESSTCYAAIMAVFSSENISCHFVSKTISAEVLISSRTINMIYF